MSRRCFTLVELLTVVAVIAILAGITIPVVVGMSSKGKEVTARADMNAIKLALTQFKNDYSIWPVLNNGSDILYKAKFKKADSGADSDIDKIMQELTMITTTPNSEKNNAPVDYTPTYNTKKRKYLEVKLRIPFELEPEPDPIGYFKLDPWGRRYNIAIDTDFNHKLVLTEDFTESSEQTIVDDIAIYSYGTAEDKEDSEAFLYSWKTVE